MNVTFAMPAIGWLVQFPGSPIPRARPRTASTSRFGRKPHGGSARNRHAGSARNRHGGDDDRPDAESATTGPSSRGDRRSRRPCVNPRRPEPAHPSPPGRRRVSGGDPARGVPACGSAPEPAASRPRPSRLGRGRDGPRPRHACGADAVKCRRDIRAGRPAPGGPLRRGTAGAARSDDRRHRCRLGGLARERQHVLAARGAPASLRVTHGGDARTPPAAPPGAARSDARRAPKTAYDTTSLRRKRRKANAISRTE